MTIGIRSDVRFTSPAHLAGVAGRVTAVDVVHPVYGSPETVTVKFHGPSPLTGERAGWTSLPGVHVDNLEELPRVVTNSVPRDVIDAHELSAEERASFDYLDWSAIDAGEDSASFFRYRGELHDLGEFTSDYGIARNTGLPTHLAAWDGYQSDSFFSALVVRFVDDGERVIVGSVYS